MLRQKMQAVGLIVFFCFLSLWVPAAHSQPNPSIAEADRFSDEHSYHLAAEKYEAILKDQTISDSERREIRFKFADSAWRTKEEALFNQAEEILTDLAGPVQQETTDKNDPLWAEANVSLAEWLMQKDRWTNQQQIKNRLEWALDFWAVSADLDAAREHFITAGFLLGDLLTQSGGWYSSDIQSFRSSAGVYPNPSGNALASLYEDILSIAKSDEDRAKATYFLGMCYWNQYGSGQDKQQRTEKYFKQMIERHGRSEWADDAFFQLGQYYEREQDFKKALETYREFLTRFPKGESQYVDQIESRVKDITTPSLNVSVGSNFLPESEIQFGLNWRNVDRAQVTFYSIDLVKELGLNPSKLLTDSDRGIEQYNQLLKSIVDSGRYRSLFSVLSFQTQLKNEGTYKPYNENKGLAEWQKVETSELDFKKGILPVGAYLLLVSSGAVQSYELVLVTDIGLVTKVAGHSALFFAFDSKTGQPRGELKVKYHYRYYNDQAQWVWEEGEGATDSSGLLKVPLTTSRNTSYAAQHNLFCVISDGKNQAFNQSNYYSYNQKTPWVMYAYSDRPAYRPNEDISFKGILRQNNGESYATPQGMRIKARIYDPRGNQVKEMSYSLNSYGSFSDALKLDDKAPLGEYRIEVWTDNWNNQLANSILFRLEEYKLPEYQVTIKPKPIDDPKRIGSYRLGDRIELELDAEYYFGGAVANADVELLIYQNPYYHVYFAERKYPWYYDQLQPQSYYGGQGQLVAQVKLKTDEHGKAFYAFDTPTNSGYDLRYSIEARVVDQSRREIRAMNDLKVMRTSYLAFVTPKQNLYRPGDKAQIDIKTLDANDQPQLVDGEIKVIRNWWAEPVPLNEDNRCDQCSGKSIRPGHYTEDVIVTKFVKTNAKGEAVFEFSPEKNGYYTVQFKGIDTDGSEITAATSVFVCDKQSRDIGYRYGGLQIIPEKDTFSIGETARVMLINDQPEAWVLLTSEAEEIHSSQVIHLEGAVKLLELPVEETWTPNIFLNALSGEAYQLKSAQTQLIVPPEKKFLNVKISSDKEIYLPGEKGNFDVELTDPAGKPVQAEISLGITDASVYYIQPEFVSDIRQFFYGVKRNLSVTTQTSFNLRPYLKLLRDEDKSLISSNEKASRSANLRQTEDLVEGMTRGLNASDGGKFEFEEVAQEQGKDKTERQRSDGPVSAVNGGLTNSLDAKFGKMDDLRAMAAPVEKAAKKENNQQLAEPQIRSDFRSTVIWQPAIVTGADGHAHVTVTFPDSLTTWRTTARAVTAETSIGEITHETKTTKTVLVRLQAPRFFTERDQATISANVHNDSGQEQKIKVTLDVKGLKVLSDPSVWVTVPSHQEKRVDWTTSAEKSGNAEIVVKAQTEKESDGMTRSYPIIPHGIEQFLAGSLVFKGDGTSMEQKFTLNLPEERIPSSSNLHLTLSPSLAGAMLDALPYLADYPYGCVEQTMSRFLPAVIVKKTLQDLGFSKNDVEDYIEHVLNPSGDPSGHPNRRSDPTFLKINQITKDSLNRLYDFQHPDGGWGWWKEGESDHFMSAYVVWGLALAKEAGLDIRENALSSGVSYLQKELVEEDGRPDTLAWMLHALSVAKSTSKFENTQREHLWGIRNQLNPYSRALFALSEFYRGNKERAQTLARNLSNGIVEDKENHTVHWGEAGINDRFSEGGVEATAFAIKALSKIDPENQYLDEAVRWLCLNRRGARWKNTRDTAIAILGLSDYLKTTNELTPVYDMEIFVNGKSVKKEHVDQKNIFTFDRYLDLPNESLKDGDNEIRVVFQGKGALYLSGYLKFFTLEEGIKAAGNEVFVKRNYFKEDKKQTLLKGFVSEWKPLLDGEIVKSGDRIRVELELEAKNSYEYLLVEDEKPAGLEAVELTSGAGEADFLDLKGKEKEKTFLYKEFRDQKAAFFITNLKQGKHRIRYELRAEVPGEFHGLPTQVHAMYVPEIRANGEEMKVQIKD